MGSILALSWADAAGAHRAGRITAAAKACGFEAVLLSPSGWLGVRGPRAPQLTDLGGGLLALGDLFDMPEGPSIGMAGRRARLQAVAWAKWGRYIALDRDGDGTLRAVLRDPSGAMEAATWLCEGVRVVSTGAPDWLMDAAPAPVAIDWSGVPALLADPLAGLTQPPLTGLTVLDAGEMVDLDTGIREQVWTPTRPRLSEIWDAHEAGAGLRLRVEAVVGALTTQVQAAGAELSGGLDSAIVAAAMGAGRDRVGLWLNAYSARPETDEQVYAAAIAARLGIPLTRMQRGEQALEVQALAATAGDFRPGFNGADPVFDMLVADACRAAGVEALFTGKGGDALFYQGATPAVFGDLWRTRGLRALMSPVLPGVARWTRQSAWSVLAETRRPSRPGMAPQAIVAATAERAETPHPWMAQADRLGPGKRLQLQALTSNLAYATACRRTAVVDLIHPLMAQPLLDWAMRIPTPVLTAGRTDRYLARTAFADSLPSAAVWRRSKGDYTATFEREAAASLPFLREHLLGGLLRKHDVIDVARTEVLLDRDRLMWGGGSAALTSAALVESWLRKWTERGG